MIVALLAIINAAYGSGEHKDWIAGKWLLIAFVAAVVYLDTGKILLSLMWMVAYAAIRVPALSGEGFGVFQWSWYGWNDQGKRVFWNSAKFMLKRTMWIGTFSAMGYVASRYEPFVYIALAALTYGLPYIIIGRIFGDRQNIARISEFVAGGLIGIMVYLSEGL